MKKMHRTIVWLTVLALVLVLAGCGGQEPTTAPTAEPTAAPTAAPTEPPITAEQVYDSVSDAMGSEEATRLKLALAYDMTVTEGEGDAAETTEITFEMVMDVMASTDPFGCYTLMDMAVIAGDETMAYTVEAYMVEEEESVVAYMQMFDTWIRSDYGMSVSDFITSESMTEVDTGEVWSGVKPNDLTLDEDTATLNGTEVYVLRGSIPAGDMSEALTNLGVEDPTQYEDINLPVVYYVDAESFLILRMEADMSFMTDILDEVLAQSMAGTDAEDAVIELNISDAVYDLGYGTPEIPAVPQEAYDYIADNPDVSGGEEDTEPTVYDGPLVLNCGDEAFLLSCPEGWTGESFGDTNVWIYNEDYTLVGDYYYMTEMTHDDMLALVQSDVDYLQAAESYVSHNELSILDGYETWEVIGSSESYYFAWREAGDGWLLVYVCNYTGTGDATELLPQFVSCLSPYTE